MNCKIPRETINLLMIVCLEFTSQDDGYRSLTRKLLTALKKNVSRHELKRIGIGGAIIIKLKNQLFKNFDI